VHDEVICEVPADKADGELRAIQDVFACVPAWADGMPLKGAGYTTPYYLKD
jgi:DNA polymerase